MRVGDRQHKGAEITETEAGLGRGEGRAGLIGGRSGLGAPKGSC